MSGYADGDLHGHEPLNSDRFLQKPFTLAAIAAKVREVLDARAAAEPAVRIST